MTRGYAVAIFISIGLILGGAFTSDPMYYVPGAFLGLLTAVHYKKSH